MILLTFFETFLERNLLSAIALARSLCARRLIAFQRLEISCLPVTLKTLLNPTKSSGLSDSESVTTSPFTILANRFCSCISQLSARNA